MARIRIVLLVLASLAAASGREFQALIAAEEARIIAALPVVPPGLNAAHALEIKESKTVSAEHAYAVSAPDLTALEWIIFTPRPPDFPGQKVLDAHTIPGSENTFELSPLKQPVMRARIPVRNTKLTREVLLKTRLDARLYSRHLIQRIGKTPEDSAAPLAARERQLFLRRTSQFDYTSRTFQGWVRTNDLVRAKTEGEVDFARRVFLRIAKNFEYEYLGEQDRKASHVCKAGKSDCGGLAVLFATVLRSQGIPARTLAGRWAVSAKPDEKIGEVKYHQEHVKAEFFAQGVGWVPVDLSSAILHDRSPGKLEYFGKDPGDFLTLHFDNDLALDTLYFGIRSMPLLQRPSYWARGSGTVDNAVIREGWNVTRRAP
jgi:transglutaminase-like putative cysteine protease